LRNTYPKVGRLFPWLCRKIVISIAILAIFLATRSEGKANSVFYPENVIERVRLNAASYGWAAHTRLQLIEEAEFWVRKTDDELWGMIFGPTIKRSWMVWTNGFCPVCHKGVSMYDWKIDGQKNPWKVGCPHCGELFPKNDFRAYYISGLDGRGIFNPGLANRNLLYNTEHPSPGDPLYHFGVDDGDGYVDYQGNRWRFIGAYLIYGQWKQLVVGGIRKLSDAYIITGDPVYAHKAAILLDRVADIYPTYDFSEQGIVYEKSGSPGYVSNWHDACDETIELAMAYDRILPAILNDQALVNFLSAKASRYQLSNNKSSIAAIQQNIENNILRDALQNRDKIRANYPKNEIAVITIKSILEPENTIALNGLFHDMILKATAVDGVTGEKGLGCYSGITIHALAAFLELFARANPEFLPELLQSYPQLYQTFRFFVDITCQNQYQPNNGDSYPIASGTYSYRGVYFTREVSLNPSMFSFMFRMYQITRDPAFVQVLYHGNKDSVVDLPYDLFAQSTATFQNQVSQVISAEGVSPRLSSVNKEQWHLGILRSGVGEKERAIWMDYDAGGMHGHYDGMTLGFFANGLDLLPDFGYPPVQYGSFSCPEANWYRMSAAHNTVVVDGLNHNIGEGKTTLWGEGKQVKIMRASGPALINGQQFERTIALVDTGPDHSYIIDVFRVIGGREHAKFTYSHFGRIATQGLTLRSTPDYGRGTLIRNFQRDASPKPGWSVDWDIDDQYKYASSSNAGHLCYTDFTKNAEANIAQAWVNKGYSINETYIPCVMVQRKSDQGVLQSTFVSVIEHYKYQKQISQARRLELHSLDDQNYPESNVALEITLADGRKDIFITADVENPLNQNPSLSENEYLIQKDNAIKLEGELCLLRFNANNEMENISLSRSRSVSIGAKTIRPDVPVEYLEVDLTRDQLSESIHIEVENDNEVPVWALLEDQSVSAGSVLSFTVLATDADNDQLSYSVEQLPAGANFSGSAFTWQPDAQQQGLHNLTFIADDGKDQVSQAITINVIAPNHAPVLEDLQDQTAVTGSWLSFTVTATDAENDEISYSVEPLPAGATFVGGLFSWQPHEQQTGTYSLTFSADDGVNQISQSMNIIVKVPNRAPILGEIPDQWVTVDSTLSFSLTADDPDNDEIIYTVAGLPPGAEFADGSFRWNPGQDQVGSYTVTFRVSDGYLQDFRTIAIVVNEISKDESAPVVTKCSPAPGAIQVPVNSLLTVSLADFGEGINPESVTIQVEDQIVYQGNRTDQTTSFGKCNRSGGKANYVYRIQPGQRLNYDQTIDITLNAQDVVGNVMSEYSYSFKTEMRSFGTNMPVDLGNASCAQSQPVMAGDSKGNIWVAWSAGAEGERDIYISCMSAETGVFGDSIQITNDSVDQGHPTMAVDDEGCIYLAWQDQRNGNGDIYFSYRRGGEDFTVPVRVTESEADQVKPVLVIDGQSPVNVYIVWQDNRNQNEDIYLAVSGDRFQSKIESRLTENTADQVDPALAVDYAHNIYVVWADMRNGNPDIYGAVSTNSWKNMSLVTSSAVQSDPVIAVESQSNRLHLLWVDMKNGHKDIFYAATDGFSGKLLKGYAIVDDDTQAVQMAPSLAVSGSAGNNLKVFACWQDERNIQQGNHDCDIYFAELVEGEIRFGANIFVPDDKVMACQSYPVVTADGNGNSHLVWVDSRNGSNDIYYSGATAIQNDLIVTGDIAVDNGGLIGESPAFIDDIQDVSLDIPAQSLWSDVTVTIAKVNHLRTLSDYTDFFAVYEFGPSSELEFPVPITVTIPYPVMMDNPVPVTAYWYNPKTGTLSQSGISRIQHIEVSSTLGAVQFKTTHFARFVLAASN